MKRKVILKRIFHRDAWRIAIIFDYDEILKAKVRLLSGAAFSGTYRCFYVDDTEDSLRAILRTLKDLAEIDITGISLKNREPDITEYKPVSDEAPPDSPEPKLADDIESEEFYRPEAIRKIAENNNVPATPADIESRSKFSPVEFRINENEGLLVIKFTGRYDQDWISELRSYGKCTFDAKRREWLLTWTKMTCDSLADYFASIGVRIKITKQVINDKLKSERKATGDEIRARDLGVRAREGLELMGWFLDENRYSPRTKESYMAVLGFFFRYFSPREPMEITEEEISLFIYDFIIRLGYSAAYQNQMVSAIKSYYTIAGKGKVNPDFFERPRRTRSLPKVFSKEEVSLILNSARNLKHKLILWMIYSCGLRRSEVTNIKLADLDRERNILHIREGKGKVDRIVPVPGKVWDKLDEYFSGYSPRIYLFEGQFRGRYSSESVYRVFKNALLNAGIKKDVGVHCLRHSYATHLHENGLDIRYIQELLGHKSTRTTEIYTHVSRRNLVAVRSPIEDLDLK